MTVFIIITTSLIYGDQKIKRDYNTRRNEYMIGITTILERCKGKPYRLVIVENSSLLNRTPPFLSKHRTFLEDFGIPVYYTRNNMYLTKNYGTKELMDIKYVIEQFGIQDNDFIVKITGRYILNKDCHFFDIVDKLYQNPYSAIVRFGAYTNYEKERGKDNCVTGLIGLKCKYLKELYLPEESKFIEQVWAEKIASLPEEEVYTLDKLGIYIRPANLPNYTLI